MKAIIFAGIGLFAAATIYGVTDFATDKKKGTIDKLYKEEPATPVIEEKEDIALPVTAKEETAADQNATAANKSTVKKKLKKFKPVTIDEIKFSDFSRGRIERKIVKQLPVKEDHVVKEEKKDE
jgi:hypothetical protein